MQIDLLLSECVVRQQREEEGTESCVGVERMCSYESQFYCRSTEMQLRFKQCALILVYFMDISRPVSRSPGGGKRLGMMSGGRLSLSGDFVCALSDDLVVA